MDDQGNPSPEEEALRQAMAVLDALPAAEVRQMLINRGLVEPAIDHVIELASSNDPTVREDARAAISEAGLDLLLPDANPEIPES